MVTKEDSLLGGAVQRSTDKATDKLMQCLRLLSSDSAALNSDPAGIEHFSPPKVATYYSPGAQDVENEALQILVTDCRWPATFNPERFRTRVRECSVRLLNEHAKEADSLAAYQGAINQLIDEVQVRKHFTVCVGIRGLEAKPITVGRCRFKRVTEKQVDGGALGRPECVKRTHVWKRVIDKMGCFTEVDAVNDRHAAAVARVAIEESLNFLRYIQAKCDSDFGLPVPEIGLEPGDAIGWTVTLVHDNATRYPSLGEKAPRPFSHQKFLQLNQIPESDELLKILSKADAARSDLEKRIILALAWIGQAVLARSHDVRFVCLTTALEAIVLRPKEQHVMKYIGARVATLMNNEDEGKAAKKAYKSRSDCVHGRGEHPSEHTVTSWCKRVCGVIATLLLEPQFAHLRSTEDFIKALDQQKPGKTGPA